MVTKKEAAKEVLGGNVFKEEYIQYYQTPPEKFDKIDFVAGTVWGKVGANAYLLEG